MTDEIDTAAISDGIFTAEIDEPGYVPEEPEKEPDKKDPEKEPEKEPEQEPDKKEPEKDKPDPLDSLKAELADARKEINRLGYALRKADKPEKKDEGKFTKAQLMQIYKEHHDDPDVAFQVIEELSQLGKADAQLAAEKSADIKTKKVQIEKDLESIFPVAARDIKDEGSDLYKSVKNTVEFLHLEGHPFADTLAFAAMALKQIPQLIEGIKTKTKEELSKEKDAALSQKAEEARKKKIEASKSTATKAASDKSADLTPEQAETAKRLGFTTKAQIQRYARMVKSKSATMEA